MSLELLAIDLGKRSFHLYGIDTDGVILSRKVSRAKLAEVIWRPGTQGNRDGSLRQRALLGSILAQRRPRGAPHQSSFCEAVRQRLEERCGRRGGDFRSSDASDNALRTGEVDGPAGPAIASSCPRPADLPTNGCVQSYPRPPRQIRGRAAARSMALYGAGTDCYRRCRPVGPGTSNLRRAHGPTGRPGSPDPE